MKTYYNKVFDNEREFYGASDVEIRSCYFAGKNDGESPFKESKNIEVYNSKFQLRYPFWHSSKIHICETEFAEASRAPFWYSGNIILEKSRLNAPKAFRESKNISINACSIISDEFGWNLTDIDVSNCKADGEYFLMNSHNISMKYVELNGKYSFQYISDATFSDMTLNTKDAFWNAKNIIIHDSTISGEYIGWYSENLTFVNCKIIGRQPFCYCKKLSLIDCVMVDAEDAFEYSDVYAEIKGEIVSVKNPLSGRIRAEKIRKVITEGSLKECNCEIEYTK